MVDHTEECLRAVEAIINFEFHDKELLLSALTSAGATIAREGNKPLALIGDAVLRLVLYQDGYDKQATIYEMTSAQNNHATNENLARIGFALGLNTLLRLNPSLQGVVPARLMATTVEAIIGAVYLDRNGGIAAISPLVIHLGIMPRL